MHATRRQALRLGVVLTTAAAAPLRMADRVLAATRSTRLTRSTFTPLVGSAFSLVTPTTTYRTVLSSVGDLPHSPAGDAYQFRLLFSSDSDGPEQGTYTFRNRSLTQQLFVVPVGGGHRSYEAVVFS